MNNHCDALNHVQAQTRCPHAHTSRKTNMPAFECAMVWQWRRRRRWRTPARMLTFVTLWFMLLSSASLHYHVTADYTSENQQELAARDKRRTKNPANLMPEFAAPIANVTAVLGRDVRLVCVVDNLGQYQVAWLKEESKTIISIDTNIIISNYRIFLIPDEQERKWVLHIKDVQESDRGYYQCQVNTNPRRSTSGYLEVVVPPTIIESHTSQVVEANERANLSVVCKASGHPVPSIVWRRDDGAPIALVGRHNRTFNGNTENVSVNAADSVAVAAPLNEVHSDRLTLLDVDRSMAGIYVCTATNGIPSSVSHRVPVYVKFAPETFVQHKYVSVSVGEPLELHCLIEAFPKANSYWSRRTRSRATSASATQSSRHGARLADGALGTVTTPLAHTHLLSATGERSKAYVTVKQTPISAHTYKLSLFVARVNQDDYGQYVCIASNALGTSETHVLVTRADKPLASSGDLNVLSANPSQRSAKEAVDESSNLLGPASASNLTKFHDSAAVRKSANGRVIYDENYLQAIKDRQSASHPSPNRLQQQQQRLKYKQHSASERNSASASRHTLDGLMIAATLHAALFVRILL